MKIALYAAAATAALTLGVAGSASAQVNLQGAYVETTVNTEGSLSSLKHDPTGGGNPGVNDYITPGTPHEGFSVNSNQTGFAQNGNASGDAFATTIALADTSGGAFDHSATWTGSNGMLTISHTYFYNDGDERINVTTVLTALTDLTELAFARSVDPDPDVNTSGSYVTNNQRGNSFFGTSDFVGSAGPVTGLTLGLLNLSGNLYTHNTHINGNCCSNVDPYSVLLGSADNTVGDHSLNMAWLIGSLAAGSSATINYAYVVGDNIDTVGGIPEPATWAMMIMGFGAIGSIVRRRKTVLA